MKPCIFKVLKRYVLLLVSCVLVIFNGLSTTSSAEAAVNGNLSQIGSQQVLKLWGSHFEMGYAHGYLLADKIRDIVDTYVVGYLATGNTEAEKVADYNSHLSMISLHHTFFPESQDEINGMVAGMNASGKNLFVPSLNRNIDERDIKAFNLFVELSFGCSSLGVWGDATANGETIIARNYDFFVDPQGNIVKDQILISYEPTGKPRFVSFAWPGWFGVVTGMNEYGITVMANAGNGDNSSSTDQFHPSIEVFRNILENTTTNNYDFTPLSLVNAVSEYTPMNIQIGSPYRSSGDPVYYVEDSSGPNVIRNAADTDPSYDHIIATNHFLKITPPPPSGDSVIRYNTLKNGLISLYGSGDRTVDSQEAWSLLETVADIVAPTLTSIIVRPNRMEFDVSFASMVNGVFKSAVATPPQTYTWFDLFPPPPGTEFPDLVISALSVPATANVCQTISITDTTSNSGSAAAGASVTRYYRSTDTVYDAADIFIGSREIPQLVAGAFSSGSISVTVPCDTSPGTYYVIARADADNVVAESDETNNSSITAQSSGTFVSGPGWVLTFSDEFNTASFDRTKWRTDFPWGARALGNGDKQYYKDDAFTLPSPGDGGYLQINTTKQNTADPGCLDGMCEYTSGMIASNPFFGQKYGYFEMRAQIPAGQGLWPAFWMLPVYSVWPPELDILEIGGGNPSLLIMSMLTLPSETWHQGSTTAGGDLSKGMHTYAVDWKPGLVVWYLDGVERYRVADVEVPAEAMYFVADMAIGGVWSAIGYPDSATDTKIANNAVPMKIDYIRVYQWDSSNGMYATIPGPTPIPVIGSTTLAIDPVLTPTTSNAQTISGTTEAGSKVSVVIDTAATAGPVAYLTQSIWSCSISGLVEGINTITVTATDAAGNTTSATTRIELVVPATITATAGSNGSITPSGSVTVTYGASQTFSILANTGYHVEDVVVDGVSKGAISSYTFTNVTTDHTIAANFAINTYSVSSVTLNPASVRGGATSQGTVTLSGTAPSGGVVVSLSDNSSAASVPASVTVPSGSSSATFTVSTYPVTSPTQVSISAASGGITKTAMLTVTPPVLNTLSVSPASVRGGVTSRGTVTLSGSAPSGGVVVSLSDNSSAASVPASVTVPSGSTSATFTISTYPVTGSTPVTITAVSGGITKTATLTVTPPVLNALSVSPASVTGGTPSQGTVSLSGTAPSGGMVVSLSDNSSAASVPASVTVPGGSTSATFTISTYPVTGSTPVTITAISGGVTKSAVLTVTAPSTSVLLSTLSVSPTSVKGGTNSQGTVTLSAPAPGGGVVVSLSDNSSSASVPASVTVPSGSTSATFTITTYPVYWFNRTATISAVYGGVTKTATLTVTR